MYGKQTVLVVDDEPKIIEVVSSFLKSKGYTVFPAENGGQALDIFQQKPISLVLLDLMLPGISGEDVCMALRQMSRVPIIMLTAKAEEEAMLRGLGIGADDYITKPFSLRTLLARMEAVLRRAGGDPLPLQSKSFFCAGGLELDFEQHMVKKNGVPVSLTPNEFKLLASLFRYPSKVFTREEIIKLAFGQDYDGFDRTVDSHMKNLRRKIETDPKNPAYIKTVRGVGYQFGGE